jgi:hypothetical protein
LFTCQSSGHRLVVVVLIFVLLFVLLLLQLVFLLLPVVHVLPFSLWFCVGCVFLLFLFGFGCQ